MMTPRQSARSRSICNTPGVEQAGLQETEQRRRIKQRTGRGAHGFYLSYLYRSCIPDLVDEASRACVSFLGSSIMPSSKPEWNGVRWWTPALLTSPPRSGYFEADMAESPLTEIQQMIGWMPSSWKEKELEVDIRMNEMYMYKE